MPTQSGAFQLVVCALSIHVTPATTTSTTNNTLIRTVFHTAQSPSVLRLQPRDVPSPDVELTIGARGESARPARAIVNARIAFDPQLDRIGPEPESAPI